MSYNLFSFLCLYRKEETMEEYKKKYEEWEEDKIKETVSYESLNN